MKARGNYFDNQPPSVTKKASYEVLIKKDIIYAQGLSHPIGNHLHLQSWI